MDKIKGGYYIKSRFQQEGEIAKAPPHVREIWDWLVREVNHSYDEKNGIKRGSTVRSLRDMQEGLCWFVGYRKERYSKSKCEMATNWLRKRGMITTTKTTRGMRITICEYDYYQDLKNYETNNEKFTKPTRNQQSPDTINKEEERKEAFRAEIFAKGYLAKYSSDMLNRFFNYWTEPNPSKTKMKFQMQQTWELSGRLATWNSSPYNKSEFKTWDTKKEDQSNFG